MKTVHLMAWEVEAARQFGMTPVEYATERERLRIDKARRRQAALKGWRLRRARLRKKA